ncbi:MAG: hypothetical protein ACI80V_001634 [Rhodothermales bacterium]|jgi:hypothetical protein
MSVAYQRMKTSVNRCAFAKTAAIGVVLLSFGAFARPAAAQQVEAETTARLAVFLDCSFCPETFIRQKMTYVDHVRDREVADVHVLVMHVNTGSGGTAHTFDLIGLGALQEMAFSTVYTTSADATEAEQRSYDTKYGVYVSRVTEEWTLQLRPFFNYNYHRFDRGDQTIESSARRDLSGHDHLQRD